MALVVTTSPLCEIAKKFKTDKFQPHQYTPVYYRLLGDRTESISRLLEVGIGKGRSLRMWEQFFPNATIYGIDIDADRLINEGRIISRLADQANEKQMRAVAKEMGGSFDVIVDDGAHDYGRQIAAMNALLPLLAKDGIYFIEDIRDVIDPIVRQIPPEFGSQIFEGAKKLPSGRGERLMILQRI